MMTRQALWSFNRFEVLRGLWKMVVVPGLTYGNAVLCLSTGTREALERRQREAGRMALGTHKGVAIEGIQGELGWSSFEAREAIAKLSYEVRAFRLPEDNVVRWLLDYMVYRERHTRRSRRTRKLRSIYGLPAPCLEGGQPAISPSALRKLANQREEAKWREGASKKVTLKIYCREKGTIRKATCYDNSQGSDLLAEARLEIPCAPGSGGRGRVGHCLRNAWPAVWRRSRKSTSSYTARP
ncbi:hypothetical protein HPB48_013927 [Haemaphysalis longicornis]|uniref:Uncharacterized protein n=1 Tax=Haemaphysalis longicornis TaxID=44386 RepID=A0A9J6GTE0_HAELO|nr:hypothetical protein HPB48_013927 [Haemaphysalis longicornis]